MSFEERKKMEDEYIQYWLEENPDWKQNPVGPLPDLTKPDGTYQDIKFINCTKYRIEHGYDLVAQKKGITGSEIDDWKENNIIDKCEYKFICYDKKIYLIDCKRFLDNVFKEINEREPTDEYSGTAFYICRLKDFIWEKIDREIFNEKIYDVYICKNCKNSIVYSWM